MRIDTGQHQRLDQRMKLAPRMIQSMEILQMATQELEARIEQELVANPTLEVREGEMDLQDIEQEREQQQRDDREGERELVVTENGQDHGASDFERLSNLSEEYGESWSNTYESGESYRVKRDDGERNGKMDAMANTASRGASLEEQLLADWHMVETPSAINRAGEFLIGFIDSDGYIRTQWSELLRQSPPGVTEADLEDALDKIQRHLEPTGIGARDLRECLLLQMEARERQDPKADFTHERTLVEDHLPDIEANRLPKVAKASGLSVDEVKAAIQRLRQFRPHPGRELVDETPQAITPDAVVDYDEENDRYFAYLIGNRYPNLDISLEYKQMSKDKGVEKKTRDFVNNNIRSATWLIDAIQQRQHTLLRVINVVIEAQRAYFDEGPQALKPLPMTLVADQLGIHVATVSRAVSEKYMLTPRGVVPLRMFFSGGTETEEGESMSWSAVQARLKTLIDEEDKSSPLSDDALVEELKKHGIEIARRTVAKYRKQLNIPTARQRREY